MQTSSSKLIDSSQSFLSTERLRFIILKDSEDVTVISAALHYLFSLSESGLMISFVLVVDSAFDSMITNAKIEDGTLFDPGNKVTSLKCGRNHFESSLDQLATQREQSNQENSTVNAQSLDMASV